VGRARSRKLLGTESEWGKNVFIVFLSASVRSFQQRRLKKISAHTQTRDMGMKVPGWLAALDSYFLQKLKCTGGAPSLVWQRQLSP
jgi:hypothetical protein